MTPFQFFLVVLIVGTVGDLLVPVLIGVKYPGYSHLKHTISALGAKASPVNRYQCINLIVVGLLLLLFSLGQGGLFGSFTWFHQAYLAGIIFFGLGCVLAGIFPEDPVGADETISGKIHGIASGIGFLLLMFNPLWAYWITDFELLGSYHIIVFVLALLTFVLFVISEKRDTGIFKYTGLLQRLNLLILYTHLVFCFVVCHFSTEADLFNQ